MAAKTTKKPASKEAKKEKEPEVKEAPAAPKPAEVAFTLDPGAAEKTKIVRAKGFKNVTQGIVHVCATFNNTQVSITDLKGNLVAWSSAGKCGFHGSKKSTAYVAQVVAQDACRQAMGHGLKEVQVRVKGPGMGREAAIRAIQAIGLEVTAIIDVTPLPHNGCRARKQRRV
jgi:small subunit ribosomal protein S11